MSCRGQIRDGYFEKGVLNMFVCLVSIDVGNLGPCSFKYMKSTMVFLRDCLTHCNAFL